MASCAASGPGASWASVNPLRYSSLLIHPHFSTRSCSMYPTRATGPPKPIAPSLRKYNIKLLIEYALEDSIKLSFNTYPQLIFYHIPSVEPLCPNEPEQLQII